MGLGVGVCTFKVTCYCRLLVKVCIKVIPICHEKASNSEFRDLILDKIICNTFDKISCVYLRIRAR